MSKSRVLVILVIALAALNIFLLGSMLMHKHRPHHEKPKQLVIEKLGFNEEQVAAYESLIDQHRTDLSSMDEQMRQKKNELYALLKGDNNEQKEQAITDDLAQLQKDIELIHFNHFRDIKNLCKENQLPKFDLMTDEIQLIFKRPKKNLQKPD